jgi:hypothetical protein
MGANAKHAAGVQGALVPTQTGCQGRQVDGVECAIETTGCFGPLAIAVSKYPRPIRRRVRSTYGQEHPKRKHNHPSHHSPALVPSANTWRRLAFLYPGTKIILPQSGPRSQGKTLNGAGEITVAGPLLQPLSLIRPPLAASPRCKKPEKTGKPARRH